MIELNIEYTYEEWCKELGWSYQRTNNKTKQKQVECVESSFEWFHPINKKTKKPKKSYIFTRQLKEPVLEDGRKNNGGAREGAGAKSLFPEEDFDVLWKVMCWEHYSLNFYAERDWYNRICFTNTTLFKNFGFDYYSEMNKIKWQDKDTKVKEVFEGLVFQKVKSETITKLCKRYGFASNSLPKTIIRSYSRNKPKRKVEEKELLSIYNFFMMEALEELDCKSEYEARKKNLYVDMLQLIEQKFNNSKEYRRYNVLKLNYINASDIDFSFYRQHANMSIEVKPDFKKEYHETLNKTETLRTEFRKVILVSVEKSVLNRIFNPEKYKSETSSLSWEQRKLLLNYLSQFTKKEYKVEFEELEKLKPKPLNLDWINLI